MAEVFGIEETEQLLEVKFKLHFYKFKSDYMQQLNPVLNLSFSRMLSAPFSKFFLSSLWMKTQLKLKQT